MWLLQTNFNALHKCALHHRIACCVADLCQQEISCLQDGYLPDKSLLCRLSSKLGSCRTLRMQWLLHSMQSRSLSRTF